MGSPENNEFCVSLSKTTTYKKQFYPVTMYQIYCRAVREGRTCPPALSVPICVRVIYKTSQVVLFYYPSLQGSQKHTTGI